MRTLCRQVDIPAITPYELRHTAITYQIKAGWTANQVAEWAGTSVRMIYKHYRHKLAEISEASTTELRVAMAISLAIAGSSGHSANRPQSARNPAVGAGFSGVELRRIELLTSSMPSIGETFEGV